MPGITPPLKKKLTLGVIFLAGLILVLIWVQGGFQSKVPAGRTPLPEKKEAPLKTIKVEPIRSTGEVTVSGSVVSRDTARIAARIQGYVVELNVEAGDRVKKDQVLLRLDNKELVEREAQAKAQLESADADLANARTDYERYKGLFEKEAVSKKTLDDVTTKFETIRAAQRRAQAGLNEAQTALSYSVVTAPFDGVVGERTVNLGDLVTPGRPLFTVYIPGTAELVAAVGEQYASYVKEKTPVKVKIPSLNIEQDTAIREVVPQREEKTRTITVKVPLSESPGLVPGLYGTLTFDTRASEAVAVPASAVRTVGQLETVRVMEHGTIRVRNVKTGRKLDDKVEILSGLAAGEEVVVD